MGANSQSMNALERVAQRFKRRKLGRLAFAFLMLAYGLAIFAPLLAGDRPYVLKGVNYRTYGSALRTLLPVAISVEELLEKGPEGQAGKSQSWEDALDSELQAAEQRLSVLRAALPEVSHTELDGLGSALEGAVSAAKGGHHLEALESARRALESARDLRSSHRALDPKNPEAGGFELPAQTSYPLLETISGSEVFCMLLWCLLVSRRLWSPLYERCFGAKGAQRAQATGWSKLGWSVALCVALAGLWSQTIGGSAVFERAPFKDALASGELQAELLLFPPFAFGFAESHLGEIHRAPTWSTGSARTLEGSLADIDYVPGDEIAPLIPVQVRPGEPAINSAWRHPLGTDARGRDLLVRLLWGARVSLAVGLIAAILVVLIGTCIGALAGYFGGRADFWISRLIEVLQCFPAFFLILLVLAYWDMQAMPPLFALVLVMALVRWTSVARLARGEFLRLREAPFAIAARASGVSALGTIFRHLLPNALGPILVAGTFLVASGILTESALSFLGFGVQEPIPSWGSLINDSRSAEHWWIQLFPGLCIFMTVVAYNLVGEALRDALDPKLNT